MDATLDRLHVECERRAGSLSPDLGESQRCLSEEGTSELREKDQREKLKISD